MISVIKKAPITVTTSAWNKMTDILKNQKLYAFLFSAKGGGCNGFNYKLESISQKEIDVFQMEKIKPTIIENNKIKLIPDTKTKANQVKIINTD